jgi:hypothetical protein
LQGSERLAELFSCIASATKNYSIQYIINQPASHVQDCSPWPSKTHCDDARNEGQGCSAQESSEQETHDVVQEGRRGGARFAAARHHDERRRAVTMQHGITVARTLKCKNKFRPSAQEAQGYAKYRIVRRRWLVFCTENAGSGTGVAAADPNPAQRRAERKCCQTESRPMLGQWGGLLQAMVAPVERLLLSSD